MNIYSFNLKSAFSFHLIKQYKYGIFTVRICAEGEEMLDSTQFTFIIDGKDVTSNLSEDEGSISVDTTLPSILEITPIVSRIFYQFVCSVIGKLHLINL